jgi:TrwC relaxase
MGAIVEVRVNAALSREFDVRWAPREDGMGHEIDGIAPETLDAFSTRAHMVTQAQLRLARQWAQRHGRAPNAREMTYLGLAANKITRGRRMGRSAGRRCGQTLLHPGRR